MQSYITNYHKDLQNFEIHNKLEKKGHCPFSMCIVAIKWRIKNHTQSANILKAFCALIISMHKKQIVQTLYVNILIWQVIIINQIDICNGSMFNILEFNKLCDHSLTYIICYKELHKSLKWELHNAFM